MTATTLAIANREWHDRDALVTPPPPRSLFPHFTLLRTLVTPSKTSCTTIVLLCDQTLLFHISRTLLINFARETYSIVLLQFQHKICSGLLFHWFNCRYSTLATLLMILCIKSVETDQGIPKPLVVMLHKNHGAWGRWLWTPKCLSLNVTFINYCNCGFRGLNISSWNCRQIILMWLCTVVPPAPLLLKLLSSNFKPQKEYKSERMWEYVVQVNSPNNHNFVTAEGLISLDSALYIRKCSSSSSQSL